MLFILCVRLTIKVKVGMPENFKVGWFPPKKLGRVTLNSPLLSDEFNSFPLSNMVLTSKRLYAVVPTCNN